MSLWESRVWSAFRVRCCTCSHKIHRIKASFYSFSVASFFVFVGLWFLVVACWWGFFCGSFVSSSLLASAVVEILVVLGFRSLFVSAGVLIPFVLLFCSSLWYLFLLFSLLLLFFPPPFSLVEVCVYEALLMFLALFFLWLTGCCEVQSIVCFWLPIDFGPRSRSPVHFEEGVRRCRVIAESWRSIWLRYLVPKRIG